MTTLRTEKLRCEIAGKLVTEALSLTFAPGQVWGILGRNGVGKTTLLHNLAGIRPRESGDILLDDLSIDSQSRKQIACQVGLLLQQHEDAFPSTVLESVLIGRHPHLSNWAWESAEDHEIARAALAEVSLLDLQYQATNTLSGGERQRVAVATVIAQDPQVFLLDEPTNHLDLHHQVHILQSLVNHARQQQRCLIMILHDLNLAARFCTHLLLLTGNGEFHAGDRETMMQADLLERTFLHPVSSVDIDGHQVFYLQ